MSKASISKASENKPNKNDPSLLPDLDGKVVAIKDFTVLLQMRRESRHELFAILRDCYDGEAAKGFGSGTKVKRFKSRFNLLAATTDAVELYGDLNQQLGERFLRYHLPTGQAKIKIAKALANEKHKTQMRQELADAALGLLQGLSKRRPTVPRRLMADLIDLADLLATGRTTVLRDRNTKQITSVPVAETGTRVANQLLRLGLSVAMVRGKRSLTAEEFKLMVKAALDTMPSIRRVVLCFLAENADGFKTTDIIAEGLSWPKATCRIALEDLHMLGLIDQEEQPTGGRPANAWKLTANVLGILKKALKADG